MLRAAGIAALVAIGWTHVLLAQTAMKPTPPGSTGDPRWQGVVHMRDGRVFVTDGGLAIDTKVAQPRTLPERVVSGQVLERYLAKPHAHEYGLADLTAGSSPGTYATPNGVVLNSTYVDYLRRVMPVRQTRLQLNSEMDPVAVVVDGRAVAVLMPVRK